MTTETVESDFDIIENRRSLRRIINGFAYDTATASSLARHELVWSERTFRGQALYINRWGKLFVHHYHQWDRYNYITPLTEPDAIKWAVEYAPHMVEGYFGKLPEEGEGEPYTPIESAD